MGIRAANSCFQESPLRRFLRYLLFFLFHPFCISEYASGEIVESFFDRLLPAFLRRLMLATSEFFAVLCLAISDNLLHFELLGGELRVCSHRFMNLQRVCRVAAPLVRAELICVATAQSGSDRRCSD